MPDLDEDAAHTLVHFLQTGQYETLGSDSDMESEYRRNVLVYKAASKYKIPSLTALARDKIEMNSEKKSIFAVLDVASKVYEHVTEEDRAWLEEHVKVELQQEFGRGDMLPFSKVVLATMNQIIRDVETKALEREPVPVEVPETPDNIWGIETPKKKKKKRAGII